MATRQLTAALRRFLVPRTSREMSTIGLEMHEAFIQPSEFQRSILVWTRIFKNMREVPETVNQMVMHRGYYFFRTEISFATYIAGVATTIFSLSKQRQYHNQQNDPQRYVPPPSGLLPAFEVDVTASPF